MQTAVKLQAEQAFSLSLIHFKNAAASQVGRSIPSCTLHSGQSPTLTAPMFPVRIQPSSLMAYWSNHQTNPFQRLSPKEKVLQPLLLPLSCHDHCTTPPPLSSSSLLLSPLSPPRQTERQIEREPISISSTACDTRAAATPVVWPALCPSSASSTAIGAGTGASISRSDRPCCGHFTGLVCCCYITSPWILDGSGMGVSASNLQRVKKKKKLSV